MYSNQHSAPSHHSSGTSQSTENHDVSSSNDFFTANLVSIAAEASNVEDDVSVNLNHHHRTHHPDVDVTLDNIHQSIQHLVEGGRADSSTSKEFRQLQQQFERHNGDLSTTDIEQTTNALMQMAQSSLAHESSIHSPALTSAGSVSGHSQKVSALSNSTEGNPEDDGDKDSKGKKSCQFCKKTFSHPGSLGRHLDLKRGTRLHPAAEIDLIRADVKRRGDAVEIKSRRAKRARVYNAREDVKERARRRRKSKERGDRAHATARQNFIERIGLPSLPPHPSFAYVVLYFLPPSQWPHDPPTTQTYGHLEQALQPLQSIDALMFNDYVNKVNVAFEQWRVMNKQSKMEIWAREQRRVAEAALGRLSLYDLGSREIWLKIEEERIRNELELEIQEEGPASSPARQPQDSDQDDSEEVGSLDETPDKGQARHILLPKQESDDAQERRDDSPVLNDANVLDPAITKHQSDSLLKASSAVSPDPDGLELITEHTTHGSRLTGSVHTVQGPAPYERSLM